jgi:tRNA/tmRNA/rRNA uracil-C5-methylase (TrmA/RlmC/RlmD family)
MQKGRSKLTKTASFNNALIEIKRIVMAPPTGSEPRINKINTMVDRMFQESQSSATKKPQMYQTMSDRFFTDPMITDSEARRAHYEELKSETRANDAQVVKTNVRMGNYPGWRPKISSSK